MTTLKFKILLLGPAMTGKTSLMYRFIENTFDETYIATLGAQFLTKGMKMYSVEGEEIDIKLIIWDVIGQSNPHYDDLRTTFYRGAEGAFLVFDLTRLTTLKKLKTWHEQLISVLNKKIPLILIGNKEDLIRNTELPKIRKKAESLTENINCKYIETSAKTGRNVEDAFSELTYQLVEREGYDIKERKKIDINPLKEPSLELFFKNKVQDYIQSKGLRVSSSILDVGSDLNRRIADILDKAIMRAKANGRKTVKKRDI
jgi:small GTP-binding protein